MIENLPRAKLGFFPTPLHKLARLSRMIDGPEIYIKRDDQSGLAMGGNKARKLEYLIGDARKKGCDTVITGGAAQSNHCRQTAAAAVANGLECHLMLGGHAPLVPDGNLLLDQLFGAQIHWCGERRKGESIPIHVKQLQSEGKTPYVIPYGGSNPIGAVGFVTALRELKAQLEMNQIRITHIVFPSSSGGTHAGLQIGARLSDFNAKVLGICVDKLGPAEKPFRQTVCELANETALMLGDRRQLAPEDFLLDDRFTGGGYGVLGDMERKAIQLLARSEGILLDPVYTARAFAAMLTMITRGELKKGDRLLFWHTGGTPALFPYAEALFGKKI